MTSGLERRMLRVVEFIHDHPTEDLSLDSLADVAALSRFHFHRVYHSLTGETAVQTVRRMRLHRAAVALVQSDRPIAGVARAAGYPNLASFTRAFGSAYGMPPAAFRNRGELRPYLRHEQPKGPIMFPIEIRQMPARHLAAVPHQGLYHEIGRAFEKLFATLGARGLIDRSGLMVGVFYDDPSAVAPADLRSHAAADMPADIALEAPLERLVLPAGRHAVLTFTGPYAGLPAAYDQLYQTWLSASGETPADSPPFEVYLNSPMHTVQEKLVTEICLPLQG
jgi:AraC family transcriptional regulator